MNIELEDVFNREWHIYKRVLDLNLLAHKEITAILHTFLQDNVKANFSPFNCLELGCGNADIAGKILPGTLIEHYCGVDSSSVGLELAKENLSNCLCSQSFLPTKMQNCFSQINTQFDVVLAGYSIHHLSSMEKDTLFLSVNHALKNQGFFIIYDAVKKEYETRDTYLKRQMQLYDPQYFTQEERLLINDHLITHDYPDSLTTLYKRATQSHFQQPQSLFWDEGHLFNVSVMQKSPSTLSTII